MSKLATNVWIQQPSFYLQSDLPMPLIMTFLGIGVISIGMKGFTAAGIPWTRDKSLHGHRAKVIGAICILLGLPMFLLGMRSILAVSGAFPINPS